MAELSMINDAAILSQICQQCRLSPEDIKDAYPCTPIQSGMMVDSALYVHTIVHKVAATVDLDRLCGAIDQVVATNDVLRTRIVDCDGPGLLQAVVRKGQPVLRTSETDLERFLEWNSSVEMHLGTPLVRFALICSGDGTRLIMTMHHVMFDFHVLEFFISDVWSVYQGISQPERAPFKEFVEHCTSINPKEASAFWEKRFSGGVSTFPPIPAGHQVLATEIMTRDIILSHDNKPSKVLPSMALMPAYMEAAWAMTVSDYTNSDSVAFGYVLSGRGPRMPGGGETTFGPTITSVPVQVDLRQNMTIQQLVKGRVASRRELSTSHFLQYGLSRIRNINDATCNASSFQSALSIVHRSHTTGLGTSGLRLDEAYTEEPPKPHGLLLICTPGEKQIWIKALFDPIVLDKEQVSRILRQLEHRLRQLVTSAPSTSLKRLNSLNFGDTLELMDWNSQSFPSASIETCLHTRIAARAADQPNDLAVRSWDGEATYAELITMVNNLAHEILIRHKALVAEEPVCIILGRSLSLVVALLAVMRAGGTCVPIDPNLPEARKEDIVRRSQARLALTSTDTYLQEHNNNCITHAVVLDRRLDTVKAAELPTDNAIASRAAYIIFTSGSTGHPKGVVLEHRSLASSFAAWADVIGWARGSRVLQYSTPSFDACAGEIMGSLQAGACVCIPSDRDRESGLGDFIKSFSIEFVGLTPTSLRNLPPEDVLPVLKSVASAGEPMTQKVFETWSDKVQLCNAWGPTEASVVASVGHLTPDARYPDTIGTPIGCALWIVDPEDVSRLLPIGAMGEMLIDGPGVAREYHLAPELTKASFIKPPFFVPKRGNGLDSTRLYRSGDLARYNPDGTISFSGRRDNQVKIRGQRFELGEVESTLASHHGVSGIVVTTYQKGTGSVTKDLVAVLTLSSHRGHYDTTVSKSDVDKVSLDTDGHHQLQEIQAFAKDRFPTYMVPTVWLVVNWLPQTPSRKVDRIKIKTWLDTVDISAARDASQSTSCQPQGDQTLTLPTTPAEVALQLAWSTVLGIDPTKIGRESSFMRLGGDSITAMQVATRCRKKGFQIAVAELLRNVTLEESAQRIQTVQDALSGDIPTMNAVEEFQLRPLSPIQKFLFDNGGPASHNQFNQAFLLEINSSMGTTVTPTSIQKALDKLVAHHSMLRCRFSHVQDAAGNTTLSQRIVPLKDQSGGKTTWAFRAHNNIGSQDGLWDIVSGSQTSLNIVHGPVFVADVIISPQGEISLFLVAHHLVVDLVSWRILWEDLEALLQDDESVIPRSLPFPLWVQSQNNMLRSLSTSSLSSWPKAPHHFWEMNGVTPKVRDILRIQYTLDPEQTAQIMGESCNRPFNTTPVILLITALILSFRRSFPDRGIPALYCEGHGRETDATNESVDTSRTIGWFTTVFPLSLHALESYDNVEYAVMAVKDEYQESSKKSVEQFALQVLGEQTPSSFQRSDIELAFNFAGRMQQVTRDEALLKLHTDGPPVHLENMAGDCEAASLLSIFASIGQDERLTLTLDYNSHMAHQDRIVHWIQEELGSCFTEMISALPGMGCRLTASDLPLLNLGSGGPRSVEYLHAHLAGLGVAQDNVESIYPCTATQEGILFAQLNGHDYHNRFVARLSLSEEEVDIDRVAQTWKAACRAHDILRTIFTTGLADQGAFQQIVLKRSEPSVSFKQMPTDGSTISQVVASQEKLPLDPKKPPHHLTLYRESASVVHAVLDVSHTLVDANTFQGLWKTIGEVYTRTASGDRATVAPGRRFSEYVVWLQSQQKEAHMHWKDYLQGIQPCVFPKEPTATVSYEAQGPFVPFNNAQQLNRFCQEQGVTNAMFLQAAWALVLRNYTGNSTVCFGSVRSDQEVLPIGGDRGEILGPLISMLPCKFHLEHPAALTTVDILETARSDASTAMRYSGCYLAGLHDELGLRDSPLFDTVMTIHRAWSTDLGDGAGGLAIEITDIEDPTEYSIVVAVQYSENGLIIRLSHQRGRVSDSLIEDIAETFARVIEYMIQSTGQPLVNILKSSFPTPDLDLLKQWNADPPTAALDQSIPSAFRANAHLQGSASAVCSWDADLDYKELDRLSDRLAYRLRVKHGVRADMIVPFCCIKASSAIVIMLAIWKAGAALLPLDFSHPEERLSAILAETEAKLVLVNVSERLDKMSSCLPRGVVDLVDLADLEQDDMPDDEIRLELASYTIEPQHAGYVVYTSGSTGRPKGLILDHRSIVTSSMHMTPLLGLTSQSRILQLTNFVFDFGLLDVMFAFFTGACICMPSQEEATNDVGGAIRRTRANFVECTPTYASLFSPQDAPSLETIVLAGEPMKQENLETWASHARIMNAYGPGETGMSSCGDVVIGQDGTFSQDIGQPFGCRYWVVNPDNSDELVPIGTTGELVIEGPIVGRGYVNNPQATAAAFIDAPAWTQHPEFVSLHLGEHRFYKSGDLVTQRSKDSFIFEGRKDYQVKIRGQRIEMGEIEHHLNQQTLAVSKWAVEVIQRGTSQEASLAAFCQVSSESTLSQSDGSNVLPPLPQTAETVREALRHAVPSYMVPEFFIPLHKLPTTGSMKTDRKALRTMANSLSQAELMSYRVIAGQKAKGEPEQSSSTTVLTGLESFLQTTWADLLNVAEKSIQPSDDFFALGGNSIRAMRLAGALRKSGYLLTVADVFRSPTITGMALNTYPLPSHRNGPTPESVDVLQPRDIARLGVLSKTRAWLDTSNIEGIAPATDLQALMLCEEYLPDRGSNVAIVTVELLAGREQQSLDLARLQEACEQIIHCHPILRTVFIQNERSLLQLTLRNTPVKQIHVLQPGETSNQRVSPSSNMLGILPHFDLISNDSGSKCLGFTLTIHHAHYDAISIGHLLEDLKNAYNGTKIFARQPSFHGWSSYVANTERLAESQGFWNELLKGSMAYPLAPSGRARPQSYDPDALQYHSSIQVPAANLESSNGTSATVLKAAWSCLLSQVLEKQDIIFSFLSANRFSNTLPHGNAEQVPGPCVNLLPVRAFMGDGNKTMATLVRELQEQSNESLPHQHIGFRSIVKSCTQWPTSRFNSAILYQNHGQSEHSLRLGDVECTIAGVGQGTNSTDVWITATPQVDHTISIELRFALDKVPMELCRWISGGLESLLNILPCSWERGIYDIHDKLMHMVGPNPLSHAQNESYMPRAEGTEPKDVVDEVLQAKHFQYD